MQSGNFTLVVLDVVDPASGHRAGAANLRGRLLPGGIWFRLQRAAEKSKSVLILLSGQRLSSGASAKVLSLRGRQALWGGGRSFPGEESFPLQDICPEKEKNALLLGLEVNLSVMKGGGNGRSIIFHCHL